MRCLVTGGSGFIGNHVVNALLTAGHDVRIFDMRKPKDSHEGIEWGIESNYPAFDYFRGSLLDPEEVRFALDDIDVVFHMAAVADVGVAEKYPKHTHDINVTGTINLLEGMRYAGVKRIFYSSTVWVYSSLSVVGAVGENNFLVAPEHIYTVTKLAGEYYVQCYSKMYGIDYTIFRYGIPYGPGQDRAVLYAFVKRASNLQDLRIEGDGSQGRYFVYVKDLAAAHPMALEAFDKTKNHIYNLEGSEFITVKDIADIVREIVEPVAVEYTTARMADYKPVKAVSEKAKEDFGWYPFTPFNVGVKEFVKWYRTKGV